MFSLVSKTRAGVGSAHWKDIEALRLRTNMRPAAGYSQRTPTHPPPMGRPHLCTPRIQAFSSCVAVDTKTRVDSVLYCSTIDMMCGSRTLNQSTKLQVGISSLRQTTVQTIHNGRIWGSVPYQRTIAWPQACTWELQHTKLSDLVQTLSTAVFSVIRWRQFEPVRHVQHFIHFSSAWMLIIEFIA